MFGFFSHPDIENPNLALFDQISALKWIQEYVTYFGGDPSNVTLIGESAGAGGIGHLIASPLSKDLFHKAVHQSGGSSLAYPTSSSDVRKLANSFANSFEDPSLKNLKNISAEEILYFQSLVRKTPVAPNVLEYAVKLAVQTRPDNDLASENVKKYVSWGAGPRASQFLVLGAKCHALLNGKYSPDIEDVKMVAKPILRHRVVKNYIAEADGLSIDDIIDSIL